MVDGAIVSRTYPFRREDNDEIVHLSFEEMMEQDAAGFVTLANGVVARRIRDGSGSFRQRGEQVQLVSGRPWISDNLGFGVDDLAMMEADRDRHGFKGVEFIPDPECRGFTQVRIDCPRERARYIKHRGMIEKNGARMGVVISASQLATAEDLVQRRYGKGERCTND